MALLHAAAAAVAGEEEVEDVPKVVGGAITIDSMTPSPLEEAVKRGRARRRMEVVAEAGEVVEGMSLLGALLKL